MLAEALSVLRVLLAGILLGFIIGKLLASRPEHIRRLMPSHWGKKARRMSREKWVRLFSTGLAAFAASLALTSILSTILTASGVELENPSENPLRAIEAVSPLLILVVANALPIFEEWIFRAVIIDEVLRRKKSKLIAILVSSLLFSIFHLSNPGTYPGYAISLFPASLVLAWCYLRAGLGSSIFAHNSYNTFIVLMNAIKS